MSRFDLLDNHDLSFVQTAPSRTDGDIYADLSPKNNDIGARSKRKIGGITTAATIAFITASIGMGNFSSAAGYDSTLLPISTHYDQAQEHAEPYLAENVSFSDKEEVMQYIHDTDLYSFYKTLPSLILRVFDKLPRVHFSVFHDNEEDWYSLRIELTSDVYNFDTLLDLGDKLFDLIEKSGVHVNTLDHITIAFFSENDTF